MQCSTPVVKYYSFIIIHSFIVFAQGYIFPWKSSILCSSLFSAFFISVYGPFILMLSIIWYVFSASNLSPIHHSYLSRQFVLGWWLNQFILVFIKFSSICPLLLFVREVHFLCCLFDTLYYSAVPCHTPLVYSLSSFGRIIKQNSKYLNKCQCNEFENSATFLFNFVTLCIVILFVFVKINKYLTELTDFWCRIQTWWEGN